MPAGADRRVVACMAYGVQLCGSLVLALAPGQLWAAWLGVLLFGSGIGNATSLPPLIAQTEFSREDALRVVPLDHRALASRLCLRPGAVRPAARAARAGRSRCRFAAAAALLQAAAIGSLAWGRARRATPRNRPRDSRAKWPEPSRRHARM